MAQGQSDLGKLVETTQGLLTKARAEIAKRIIGQERVIDLALITLLSGGHCVLVGVPGLAKTRLVETLGTVMGLSSNRVQFTPDLMPADIIGSEVMDQNQAGDRSFRFIQGPVFSQLLMADEINRASPRTQSALLQSMQERQVSVAGVTYDLPAPFHVMATQNPIEQEGTYPLPEAQLDRFLLQIDVKFPDRKTEREILLATTGFEEAQSQAVFSAEQLLAAQGAVRRMPVGDDVVEAILNLVRSARPEDEDASAQVRDSVNWGPGPRAAQSLMLAVRAAALIDGRSVPSVDDVVSLAHPVLIHRMALGFAARAGGNRLDDLITDLAANITNGTFSS